MLEIRRTARLLRARAVELRAELRDHLARMARQTGERMLATAASTDDPPAAIRRGEAWVIRGQEHTAAAELLRRPPTP